MIRTMNFAGKAIFPSQSFRFVQKAKIFFTSMVRSEIIFGVLLVAIAAVETVQSFLPFALEDDLRGFPATKLRSLNSTGLLNRLDPAIVPINYELRITPMIHYEGPGYPGIFTAPGLVHIIVDCTRNTQTVKLHAAWIEIVNVTIFQIGDSEVHIDSITDEQETSQTITINTAELLEGERYNITINFVAQVNDGTSGLYRSSYLDDLRVTRDLATTQFEQTGARQAFPCFDEPALRATFDIRIGRNRNATGYHTMSNMPQLSNQPDEAVPDLPDGYFYDYFERTPPMSTYLIAIIASNFDSVATTNPNVKVYGPENHMRNDDTGISNGEYAATTSDAIQNFFEGYFKHDNIPELENTTKKLYSVAVPDFSPGAMENWGLNTYRISNLLFVDGDMTQHNRWSVAAVLSHEISHQWFGNLVTIEWWNDYYLKEGFARYLQFLGVAGTDDQFPAMERIVVDALQVAMKHDVLPDSHPIWRNRTDIAQDQNSRIIYEKAASVIRMMEGFLNEVHNPIDPNGTVLQRALVRYLVNNINKGYANQEDLYAAIQAQVEEETDEIPLEKPIKEIMDTWTTQTGYPLIRASRVSSFVMYISQEQYVVDVNLRNSGVATNTWEVPIAFITQAQAEDGTTLPANYRTINWISANEPIASIEVETSGWVLLNPEAKGYYRVLYDDNLFGKLLVPFQNNNHTHIPVASRSQLFDDYFNFAFDHYAPIERALDLIDYLDQETELSVWTTALTHFRKIYNHLRNSGAPFVALQDTLKLKIQQPFTRLINAYTPIDLMLKNILMDWVCTLAMDECLTETERVLTPWAYEETDRLLLFPEVMFLSFCRGYQEDPVDGGQQWRTLIHERYKDDLVVPTNYNTWLYRARGCVDDTTELQALLEGTLDSQSTVPKDHRKMLIDQIAGRSDAFDAVMDFIETKTDLIIARLGDNTISSAIAGLSTYSSTLEDQARVQKYHDDNQALGESLLGSIRNSIAAIQLNREWSVEFGRAIECKLAPTNCQESA